MMWATLHIHEVMAEFSKHEIKLHPYITYIFVRFLIMTNISEPPKEIAQMNRDIKVFRTKSARHDVRMTKLKELSEARVWALGDPTKLAQPSINIVIRYLLLDYNSSLKIGLFLAEGWPTWKTVLPSLGYPVLKTHAPARLRKILQGGTLNGADWLPINQVRRISNFQDTCFFVSGNTRFVRQVWGGVINKDRTTVLMYGGYRVR